MTMTSISSEIAKLKCERDNFKLMYRNLLAHVDSLNTRLETEITINDQYRAWFNNHKHIITSRPEPITSKDTMYADSSLSTVEQFTDT